MPASQLKVTAALAGLVALVLAVAGGLAERDLRRGAIARIERSLEERADLVREVTRGIPFARSSTAALDALTSRYASGAGARLTLISPDGTVVADSDVPVDRLPAVKNHANRPEVDAALHGRVGRSARRSETVNRRLFYLAIPVDGGSGGAVRLAVDLEDVEAAVRSLRMSLLAGGAVGLLAAVALGYGLAWYSMRPLERMRRAASSLARGEVGTRLPVTSRDVLAPVAEAINLVGEQLRLRLDQVTQEKDQLQAVLDAMVEGVLVVDAKGRIVLANSRMRELYDAWGEIEGRAVIEAIRNAELDAVLRAAAETDDPVSREVGSGPPRDLVLRVHAIRFPAGDARRAGTVAVFDDVTELRRLEMVRRDFVANASHELRTPLAAIRGFAETLLDDRGRSAEDQRSRVEVIDRHARRLENLVDDLLELSRLESRDATLSCSAVDVAEAAATVITDSRPRFEARRVEVSLERGGDTRAWADPRAVDQILMNLLDNAAKYTGPGGRVEVSVEGAGGTVRLSVRDNGIGIPESDRERIFERFYRVDRARSRALGGTGLGLSIVKHLVQRLGGQISLQSRLDEGSVFTVTLPTARTRTNRREPAPGGGGAELSAAGDAST